MLIKNNGHIKDYMKQLSTIFTQSYVHQTCRHSCNQLTRYPPEVNIISYEITILLSIYNEKLAMCVCNLIIFNLTDNSNIENRKFVLKMIFQLMQLIQVMSTAMSTIFTIFV